MLRGFQRSGIRHDAKPPTSLFAKEVHVCRSVFNNPHSTAGGTLSSEFALAAKICHKAFGRAFGAAEQGGETRDRSSGMFREKGKCLPGTGFLGALWPYEGEQSITNDLQHERDKELGRPC